MDSGNSGSLQSSSGADEEYDSRAAVDSHAANFITTHHQPHPPPPPPPPFNHHMFDQNQINNPLFFSASPQHQLLNLDSIAWSKTLPSFSDHHLFPSLPTAHTVPFSPATTITTTAEPTTAPPTGARNPKKRSRASRRAPTTVLTTDTSNFRAMVQEFTGIPAPPFTSSSSPASRLTTSFDLFGRPSSMTMMRSNNFDNLPQLPPYHHHHHLLLRPFPQKPQSSSPSISSLLNSSNLLTTMQNTISSFPSNSLNQSSFLNPKTTQNVVSSNGYGVIGGQAQIHELHTSLPDLVSSKGTAPTPTTTTPSDDQMASGNWDGGGVNYTIGKESSRVIADHHHSSGMKADQGFIEPWICSSD
ncbi:hypothetical protein L6452_43658 [Arctium lappa]|uniref:Uncharacterized protein n=1 Tax=Arctium lappa TaxID=4217 RepID=A0ACB8XDN1_ARCLA|nr:hypothetical protein L6452_43658 [Arctium lappa]